MLLRNVNVDRASKNEFTHTARVTSPSSSTPDIVRAIAEGLNMAIADEPMYEGIKVLSQEDGWTITWKDMQKNEQKDAVTRVPFANIPGLDKKRSLLVAQHAIARLSQGIADSVLDDGPPPDWSEVAENIKRGTRSLAPENDASSFPTNIEAREIAEFVVKRCRKMGFEAAVEGGRAVVSVQGLRIPLEIDAIPSTRHEVAVLVFVYWLVAERASDQPKWDQTSSRIADVFSSIKGPRPTNLAPSPKAVPNQMKPIPVPIQPVPVQPVPVQPPPKPRVDSFVMCGETKCTSVDMKCGDDTRGSFGCFFGNEKTREVFSILQESAANVTVMDGEGRPVSSTDFLAGLSESKDIAVKVLVPHDPAYLAMVKRLFDEEVSAERLVRKALGTEVRKYTTYYDHPITKKSCFKISWKAPIHVKINGRAVTGMYLTLQRGCRYDLWAMMVKDRSRLRADAVKLDKDVGEFFDMFHKHGAHRDIKPGNIVWCPDENRYKVIDFGLATTFDDPNLVHDKVGTMSYISPLVKAYVSRSNTNAELNELKRKFKNPRDLKREVAIRNDRFAMAKTLKECK